MAKDSRGRLRVFFAEFDGDNQTIQEGLRSISLAVAKTFQPTVVVRRLTASPENPDAVSDEATDDLDDVEMNADDYIASVPPKSRTKRKPPTMTLVKDLNLRPAGKPHLREFFADKQPKSQPEQITVCVYYLWRIVELEAVTPHHVYSCLKEVGVKVPVDLPQTIRNVANRRGTVDTSDSNNITLTIRGENMVEHELNGSHPIETAAPRENET